MPTRNVVLTDHQHQIIESLVGSGRYQNASEVLRDGLRLVEQREAEEAAKLQALREAANVGWRDIEAGRYRDVSQEELVDYVGQLGARASKQVRAQS
ncbi:MAG: type II toxin-antitoxin system ParD family antitoxin [Phenylobacterium sp.]|uniref:type II toxin-antitoxin system ParD family antitoxin n=1 Tax=Phenylobacterium sp. TaxID=1871053 RepID=UPI00273342BB|nr:type II toxin-antitoxin system ParD family antitoxin [Phenylobacterium sp.]MDP3747811.1 type II toxin-antitoxin system ParD family antitoxin [Phenylobacterium sp.]